MANGELGAENTGVNLDGVGVAKLAYQRPSLTVYGSVRELTGAASGTNGDGKVANMVSVSSDPIMKENVVQIGIHPAGFGIYLFDYKSEHRNAHGLGRQFGVMANEVEAIIPEAVVVQENGYRAVNYSMLGITRH